MKKTWWNYSIIDWITGAFLALYGLAAILVSLHRYWQYEVFYLDFGIFDQAIWKVSRFMLPVIDHVTVGGKHVWADHFHPSILLLAPLYWLTDKSEILLIAQATAVTLSGLILYQLAKHVLAHKLLSLSVVVTYLLFVGIQNAIITEFHEVTVATVVLASMFYAIALSRKKLFFILLILLLGFKESLFFLGVSLGVYIFLSKKSWRLIGIATILISCLWGYIAIAHIIPYFSGGIYQYAPYVPKTIEEGIASFYDHPIKPRTMLVTLGSFLFLPLLVPASWPLILQDFIARFTQPLWHTRWDVGLHYSALLGVALTVSSIYAIAKIQKYASKTALIALSFLLIGTSVYLHQFVLHGPLGLSYNKAFYGHTKNFAFLNDLVAKVPPDVTVMAQNNIASRFTHQTVWMMRDTYTSFSPQYIVFDTRDGQNPNNFFGMRTRTVFDIHNDLQKDPDYELFYESDHQFIYRRKAL